MIKKQRSINILYVEDNPADIRLTEEALKGSEFPYKLNSVESAKEALNYLENEENDSENKLPDIVLVDLNMPGMSGFELIDILKQNKKFRSIPVIVLTSSDSEEDIKKAYSNYANCYIRKPIDLESYMIVIKTIEQYWYKTAVLAGNEMR